MSRVRRLLRPGGLVYVSDLLLRADRRHRLRYERSPMAAWASFEFEEGARLRHFDEDTIARLLQGFEELSMNGNPARAFQSLARWPGEEGLAPLPD